MISHTFIADFQTGLPPFLLGDDLDIITLKWTIAQQDYGMDQNTDDSTDDEVHVLVLGVCIVQIFAIYKYDTCLLPKTFHVYGLWFTLRPATLPSDLVTPE